MSATPILCGWLLNPADRDQTAETPEDLMTQLVRKYGQFDFDPCPPEPNFDGLDVEWGQNNFVNPPFKHLSKWIDKCIKEWNNGSKQVILLCPMRAHTSYFQEKLFPLFQEGKVKPYILSKRLRFKNYKNPAPFGVMIIEFPKSSKNDDQEEFDGYPLRPASLP